MKSTELRQKFLDFFEKRGHKVVPGSSLLPTDPSVLFTTAGMQQFKPYYTAPEDAMRDFGTKNVVTAQKCIRTNDIDEVGDNTHLTFFEMLGNFSFGGYGRREAITYAYDFITKELNLEISYVSIYKGEGVVPKDEESANIWKELDSNLGIREEGADVFWGPTGDSGPCGPTTEIYCKNAEGKDVEIWNLVFNEYFCDGSRKKLDKGEAKLTKLSELGIDTGMGLERLLTIVNKKESVYDTDLFEPIISKILSLAGIVHDVGNIPLSVYPLGNVGTDLNQAESVISVRVMADHIKAATFLISDGAVPSNKDQGYILRRLIRRIITRGKRIGINKIGSENFLSELSEVVIKEYERHYPEVRNNCKRILKELDTEEAKFRETLTAGLRKIEEYVLKKESIPKFAEDDRPDFGSRSEDYTNLIPGKDAFDLYQTYGFPPELLNEELSRHGMGYHKGEFEIEVKKHQELSRTASAGMFRGGLADNEPQTIKLHTAHHLLLAALQEMFGKGVKQKGSNINQERLRIDFSFDRKITKEELEKIESMVNEKVQQGLDVVKREVPIEEAQKIGAEMEFGVKYGNMVSVYYIEDKNGTAISKEFCGGPHVKNTSELGKFKILKEEASSRGVRRIKAILE